MQFGIILNVCPNSFQSRDCEKTGCCLLGGDERSQPPIFLPVCGINMSVEDGESVTSNQAIDAS